MEYARGLEVFAGAVLILATFYDLFKSVVLPRPAINKFVLIRKVFFLPGDGAWEHFSNARELRFGPEPAGRAVGDYSRAEDRRPLPRSALSTS